jgi:hypothetical protein
MASSSQAKHGNSAAPRLASMTEFAFDRVKDA